MLCVVIEVKDQQDKMTDIICVEKVELEFLPPHKPTEEEKADPMLFASNVRKEMANALGVQLCDLR